VKDWIPLFIGGAILFLLLYTYAVVSYLRGKGREKLEGAIKALSIIGGNGAVLEIVRRKLGVILVISRTDGGLDWANLALKVPFSKWSLEHARELRANLEQSGFEVSPVSSSIEWIAEVRIHIDNIWAPGSSARGTEAAKIALDALGFGKDERFIFRHRGKNSLRVFRSRRV
jgi:hypothetical protein